MNLTIVTVFALQISIPLTCASLGKGGGDTEATPLTNQYKTFRSVRRQLYIQNFENRSYAPQLTGRLKDKLQSAFARIASLTVTAEKEKADAVLYGKILLYGEEPAVFDRASMPISYNLTIVATTRLRAKTVNEEGEAPEEQLTVRATTVYYAGEPVFEQRFTAEERLLENLADRIANSTYETEKK